MKPIIDKKLPRIFDKDLEYFQERNETKEFHKNISKMIHNKTNEKKMKDFPSNENS